MNTESSAIQNHIDNVIADILPRMQKNQPFTEKWMFAEVAKLTKFTGPVNTAIRNGVRAELDAREDIALGSAKTPMGRMTTYTKTA